MNNVMAIQVLDARIREIENNICAQLKTAESFRKDADNCDKNVSRYQDELASLKKARDILAITA